jgi:flagellar biosynthesis GTPase FlhF
MRIDIKKLPGYGQPSFDEKMKEGYDILKNNKDVASELMSYDSFLQALASSPESYLRSIQQVIYQTVMQGVKECKHQISKNKNKRLYDGSKLLTEGTDKPFFSDYIFVSKLMELVEGLISSKQQNRIINFVGPPGAGKSTFLNKLLLEIERYTASEDGTIYELVWRIPREKFNRRNKQQKNTLKMLAKLLKKSERSNSGSYWSRNKDYSLILPTGFNKQEQGPDDFDITEDGEDGIEEFANGYLEIPCPSHDPPITLIDKNIREEYLKSIWGEKRIERMKTLCEAEYNWVFNQEPCTICQSLYKALLNKFDDPLEVLQMLYVRPYVFNRRLGNGITVCNPGDKPERNQIFDNPALQRQINNLLGNSDLVSYIYSIYAKTNGGIYALMDVKGNNVQRFKDLHNVISEGVIKVRHLEEPVNSIIIVVTNHEDSKEFADHNSFLDRIEFLEITYTRVIDQEVKTYLQSEGKHIKENFLPGVLENFARVIISSRLRHHSNVIFNNINNQYEYSRFCDDALQLLRLEIIKNPNSMPEWLKECDKNALWDIRDEIIDEASKEGTNGISGRESPRLIRRLISEKSDKDHLISTVDVCGFFEDNKQINHDFLAGLQRMDNYHRLQEIKKAMFNINRREIEKDIHNYLFAINLNIGDKGKCNITDSEIEVTDEYLLGFETYLWSNEVAKHRKIKKEQFLEDTNKTELEIRREAMQSRHLREKMQNPEAKPEEHKLFKDLMEDYSRGRERNVLGPFMHNDNFVRAIKDYGTEGFKTYDKTIRNHVKRLIANMQKMFNYNEKGARETAIYIMENQIWQNY